MISNHLHLIGSTLLPFHQSLCQGKRFWLVTMLWKFQMEMEDIDEDIKLWSSGKETNIRLLLSTLHHVRILNWHQNLYEMYSHVFWILQWHKVDMLIDIVLLTNDSDSMAQEWLACNSTYKPYGGFTSEESLSESKIMPPPGQTATERSNRHAKICSWKSFYYSPGNSFFEPSI